jgi:hypothetical protein
MAHGEHWEVPANTIPGRYLSFISGCEELNDQIKTTEILIKDDLPILDLFIEQMKVCFADKFKSSTITDVDKKITVSAESSRPTAKNPNGVLKVVFKTKDTQAIFYEWANKFYMSQLVNYSHYMKPIKK